MKRPPRYFLRELTRPPKVRIDGSWVAVPTDLPATARKWIYRGDYEAPEREIVAANLRPGETVLEIGAGIGVVTLLACRIAGAEHVHAFEANRALRRALAENCAINEYAPHIDMRMVATDAGEQTFHIADRFIDSSPHPVQGTRPEQVESVAFSQLMAELHPAFLIVDAEGSETDLLSLDVDYASVRAVCVETHPHITGDRPINAMMRRLIDAGLLWRMRNSRGNVLFFARDD